MAYHGIETGAPMEQEVMRRYKTEVPDELMMVWENYGKASLMGGYLRVIDPEDYQELLKKTYFRGKKAIPILVTAFGDIITLEEKQYIGLVEYKNGKFSIIAKSFKRFVQNLRDNYFLDKYFQIPQYVQAKEKLGSLKQNECFGYVPLLGLGGNERVDNLKKVDTQIHIELICHLTGKIE